MSPVTGIKEKENDIEDMFLDPNIFIYLFIYRFVQCTGERTIGHVVPYLVHPPNPTL